MFLSTKIYLSLLLLSIIKYPVLHGYKRILQKLELQKDFEEKISVTKDQKDECDAKGGSNVGHECLSIVTDRRPFKEAREFCQSQGGDLWSLDGNSLNDSFLSQKFIKRFPQFFYAGEDSFYIGILRTLGGIARLSGEAVTNATLIRMGDSLEPGGGCFVISHGFSRLKGFFSNCLEERAFICRI